MDIIFTSKGIINKKGGKKQKTKEKAAVDNIAKSTKSCCKSKNCIIRNNAPAGVPMFKNRTYEKSGDIQPKINGNVFY